MILAGTLYRFTSPPSQEDVRIAVFANFKKYINRCFIVL